MAVAPGNALFQLKKGGILAPAIFANLRESQEAELRERPEGRGTVIFWLHRWESSGRMLSVGKRGFVKSSCSRPTYFTPIFSTAQETSAIPLSRMAQRRPGTNTPTPFPYNSPGSSWRRHFPSGSKTQAPAKKTDTGFQNQPSFLMKMSTFWPSIPNWDENFTIKTPNSKGHVSAASSVWHASLLPCCLPGSSPSSA